jgi:hypothetical protein
MTSKNFGNMLMAVSGTTMGWNRGKIFTHKKFFRMNINWGDISNANTNNEWYTSWYNQILLILMKCDVED